MRRNLLDELEGRSHRELGQHFLLALPSHPGWEHKEKRYVHRGFGTAMDFFAGPDEEKRYWASFFSGPLTSGDRVEPARLAKAIGHWIKEGERVQVAILTRDDESSGGIGVEVRFRVGAPRQGKPTVTDEKFDMSFSEKRFIA